jgi:hypothetical protein
MAKRLVERMSSIVIDEESITCLLELVVRKIEAKSKMRLKMKRGMLSKYLVYFF